jgi:hypothetical protein
MTDDIGKVGAYDNKGRAPTSSFGKIGALSAIDGNIVLRGRDGERDHVYSLHEAMDKYSLAAGKSRRMAMVGDIGFLTYTEIAEALKAYILEAIDQRRSYNYDISPRMLEFEASHKDKKPISVSMPRTLKK